MTNRELAKIFSEISIYLEMKGVSFKPYAYQKAALALESLEKSVDDIYKEGGLKALEKIPGVGKSIAEKIEEYLKTGKIKYYEEYRKKIPVQLEELTAIEGLGPHKIKILYQKLGIKNLRDLEKAAKEHKIAPLFRFGEKTEKNILQGIELVKKARGRFLLGEILPVVRNIENKMKELKEVEKISVAGSVRRRKETIGDVDLLVVSKRPTKVMDFFVSLPGIIKIWGKGPTKSSVRLKEGFDVDLRIVRRESYGSALQYFTGSKEHNIMARRIAMAKGLKLNEYGVLKGKKRIAGRTEEEVYKVLGMDWVPPEMRENRGEIEAALSHHLPKIIGYNDIKGDLHCHSKWDGGGNSIEEMAEMALFQGYEYLGITDHTKFLRIEHGLDEKKLSQQRKEIDKLNSRFKTRKSEFKILQGCEANILGDGSLDINEEAQKKLDYVVAGIHSQFKMTKEKMTERIIRAIKNPFVKIIAHPTGRIIHKREPFHLDLDRIFRAAKEYGVAMEINSWPERLDLSDINIRRAKEAGVKMVINTDSHQKSQMRFIEFGISQARRGWAEKKDIINTYSLKKLLEFFR